MVGGQRWRWGAVLCLGIGLAAPAAWAGDFSIFGAPVDYKVTVGYAAAFRMEQPSQALVNGPVDQMVIQLNTNPASCPTLPTPCIGAFGHSGLPVTVNFDDGNNDFGVGDWLNNRWSVYSEAEMKLNGLGLGDIGIVASGAAHYDHVFLTANNNNATFVNRMAVVPPPASPTASGGGRVNEGNRYGPINEWLPQAVDVNGKRHRMLETYVYGQWNLTDTVALSLRAGKHLAAWGESLFFPGIVSAQGPFDATKANVPGVEVKEILLPVNQVSMQLGLTSDLTVLGYKQFEFHETEIFPEGDFFSPADLVGPGSSFGFGSINPVSPTHCNEPTVTDTSGNVLPGGNAGLCQAAGGFENQPEYINTLRTPDAIPNHKRIWGAGLKYQVMPDLNVGAYYIKYNNHNPNVGLNMGYAFIGDVKNSCGGNGPTDPNCQHVYTDAFNVRVPVSYTVGYADNVEMEAISFSTVFWVFNIGGEIIRRNNVDTSLEAIISGVDAPVGTRGSTNTAQMSFLYVNNPGFVYDEIVVVGEMGYTQVDKVDPRRNEDGICFVGTDPTPGDTTGDCAPGKPAAQYTQYGKQLFYDKAAEAIQMLIMPKARNAMPGWDIGTPITLAYMKGTPSTPGVFGALYGDGDTRVGLGVTGQYVQNFEVNLTYNMFLGDAQKYIRNSTLHANPYVDHDYLALSLKYNL